MEVNITKSFSVPPVAIIGIGCFFPRASGLKAFWHLLYHGKDAISDVPSSHWSTDDYYSEDPRQPDHVYCRRGGFLSPVPFDPTAFGIPPSNLEATDTSQILGLIAAKTALEQAGYGEDARFERDQTAVILGVTGTQELVIPLSSRLSWPQWRRALEAAGVAPEKSEEVMARLSGEYVAWQENSFPGLLGNVVAGRICNRLDLGGTNCVVDAACASSMSAINLALMELYTGRARMAVTGGVDTLNDIFMHMCFARTQILSPSGDARPFSRNADGTVLGEGVGILILKRLADAEADGDRILAVLKGIGSSSDGKSQSIYAPRAEGQLKALRNAYAAAQVTTDTVSLIEAHGTGTRVGDKIEVQALRQLFGPTDTTRHCALGSVKSMIGHTKAAAGAAGLIKTALALHNKVLPPTLKADDPDPDLELEKSPFYLNAGARPWFRTHQSPRRAGVSAFGFGGSNFHVVLEEYEAQRTAVAWDGSVEIIALSAASREELGSAFQAMRRALSDAPPESLPHIARQSRSAFDAASPFRLLLILTRDEDVTGPRWNTDLVFDEAAGVLEENTAVHHTATSFLGSGERPGRIVFLFPGQGSQYLHMGRDLAAWFPEALAAMESANSHFSETQALTDYIFPLPDPAESPSNQEEALRNTAVAQPAIGALSVAMEKILRRFGLTPEATCGHSYGELTALYSAGWIDEDTLHALSTLRGRLMADAGGRPGEPNGAMMAVKAPLEKLERLIEENDLDVVLANRNSPNQGILSGDVPSIDKAETVCKGKKLRTIRLPVSAAFHSRLVESAREPFAEALASFDIRPSKVPVYSNTTGMPYPGDPAEIRALLGQHLRNPVDFVGEIENLYAEKSRIFVEVGPKTVLSGLVRAILKGRDFHALAMDASSGKKFGILDLAQLLCQLAALGCPINWDEWEAPGNTPPRYKMRIPVRGANFRPSRSGAPASQAVNPPPAALAKKRPLPQPEKVDAPKGASPAPPPEPSRVGADTGVIEKTTAVQSGGVNPTPVSKPVNDPQHPVLKALQVVQEGLQSLQALQSQTVEAHQKFLDTQQQASRTLQEMMESSRRFAETLLGGYPGAPGTISPSPADPVKRPRGMTPTGPPIGSEAASRPPLTDQTDDSAASHNTGQSRAVDDGGTIETVTGGEYDSTPVSQTLLAVISELTGYPVDMLGMDMHIETDLGIDSIKRVEILSRVEEKLPGLPPMTPDMIAEFQTIGQVAAYLSGQPAKHASARDAGGPDAESSRPDLAVSNATTAALLSVVSELTGYPEDMLNLDMDVEADLGIDSIKRVEILSALEDRLSDFPAIAPDEMAGLKTLGQIASRLQPAGEQLPSVEPAAAEGSLSTGANSSDEIHAALMAVVSDLTGYPVEMLSSDMDIEADLGIDSIKRVEILSAMEDRLPERPSIAPDEMAELKTLGQIAAVLAGGETSDAPPVLSADTPAVPESIAPAGEPASSDAPLSRRKLAVVDDVHNPAQPLALPKDRKIFITTDKTGLSHALADQLSAQGLSTVQISIDILKHRTSLPEAAGLILLCDVDEADGAGDRTKAFLEDAFALTHHLGPSLQAGAEAGGAFLATVSRLDGTFGVEGLQNQPPHQGGLAGLAKTAAIEWPDVLCRALDIDAGWKDNPAIARQVVSELLQPDPAAPVEVGLAPERRVSLALTPAPLVDAPRGGMALDAGDVVVISGGARGVTAAAAEALARRCSLTLILLGRSPKPFEEPEWLNGITQESEIKKTVIAHDFASVRPTPQAVEKACRRYRANREIRNNLARIKALGADVRYFSLDIRNADRVQAVLNDVRLVHGPIKALIHGAGVLRDRLITEKTSEEFHHVLSTKVDGFENLLAATRDDPLGYIVLFSSVAARFGNVGQVDYAVANEVLNKMAAAEAARRDDCVVRAINWGPWDGGMVDAHLKKVFLEKGIALIPLEKGAEAFVAELEAGDRDGVEVVIGSELPASREDQRPTASAIQPASVAVPNNRALSTIFISELNLEHYPILDHHRLDGKPVVPFALMAEWFSHGALHNNPGLQLAGLDDMRLMKGIVLADRQRPIRVLAAPARSNGSGISVDLELRDGLEAGAEVIHSRTTAILTDRLPSPPDFAIPAALQEEGYSRDVAQIYRDILFHGSALHGIQRVRACNAYGMRADLVTAPAPTAWIQTPPRNRWIADPLVMDGAFQMASLWCYEEAGRVSLPSYTAAYRQYCRKFPATTIQAVLVVKDVSRYKLVGDFTFLDPEGSVLAEITGYEAVMEDRLMRAFKPQHYATGR